ncbi:3-deoxy-7-phosphoheptulonate synthase [Candidatus Falkowbacteria bacterium CG10_big_fil_rev_8_21_14_0_10_43_10]|uniref:Phospho-2-dehydro-3-deoxyheptonate aldolase n=1 Tax=Candidatus Falkowbacteria bacterium CG10_big_fil_rev_8_21_14_0_10_43_10 TaxID=1974567 RepID=A0A2H0V1X7_9BACT|nr:MAG: 3-deoxy-7-phosphoheptulonate synthase [Candidatus Falkowbacteria bacterium CG10_big_fil_rev_8_21_14_0_10_43_10]
MLNIQVEDANIEGMSPLISPKDLKSQVKRTAAAERVVIQGRMDIRATLQGENPRLLVVVGPCSIHDTGAAMEYARKLQQLSLELSERLCIVIRTYFEKPRTIDGWTGLIADPYLDGTGAMNTGLQWARQLLLTINELCLPTATEFLDPLVPQFISDLVAWAAIGARTTESQTHRQMASGFSMPVGFKNSTDGNVEIAVQAMQSARGSHTFIGVNEHGQNSIARTKGNQFGHLVLRGGKENPNYDETNIASALRKLEEAGLPQMLMVDCSHANSRKDADKQIEVCREVVRQRAAGNSGIMGIMLESNLFSGSQKIPDDPGQLSQLQYGVSVTDACIGWEQTEELLREIYEKLPCCARREAIAV